MKFLQNKRNGWICVWLACIAMFLAVMLLVVLYSVRMPLAETFYLVTVYERFLQHGFSDTSALMLRIGEHLIIIPIILVYGLSALLRTVPLSERGILLLNLLGPAFSLVSLTIVAAITRSSLSHRPAWVRQLLVLTSGAMLFSLSQWETWSTSTFSFTMTTACSLGAIWLLYKRKHTTDVIVLAALLCITASFSISNGSMTWIICAPLLVRPSIPVSQRRKVAHIVFWLLLTIVSLSPYVLSVQTAALPGGIAMKTDAPARIFAYFFALLGAPVVALGPMALHAALVTGLLIFLVFPFVCTQYRKHGNKLVPWVSIYVFCLLTAALIVIGRSSYGLHSAMSSRYTSLLCPATIAVLALLAIGAETRRRLQLFCATCFVVLFMQIPVTFFGIQRLQERAAALSISHACMQTSAIASNMCLGRSFFGNGEFVRYQAAIMERLGMLTSFSLPSNVQVVAPGNGDGGWVDWVGQGSGTTVEVTGWALHNNCAARDVVFTAGPEHALIAYTHTAFARPDTEIFSGCRRDAAWRLDLDTRRLPPAALQYPIQLWVYDKQRAVLIQTGSPMFSLQFPAQLRTTQK